METQPQRNGLLSNLWNKGELPTVNTAVEIDKSSIDYLAIALVVVIVIGISYAALVKALTK